MSVDLTVIILTYNEECNIAQALESVCGWARQVLVLDSFSTDRTLEVAAGYDCQCFRKAFAGYSAQRNYALRSLPIAAEWVMFVDADEWLPEELKAEIAVRLAAVPAESGLMLRRRFIWNGRWIRHGYYQTWILRLFRHARGRCEERGVNEHIVVDGPVGYLRAPLVHESHKGIGEWIDKHNRYAALEARELIVRRDPAGLAGQPRTKRWLIRQVWERMPPLWRAPLYFCWRYFVLGGFLDGAEGFSYHLLQALWFRLLIDLKYLELRDSRAEGRETLAPPSVSQASCAPKKASAGFPG